MGQRTTPPHLPVMLGEVLELFRPAGEKGGVLVDCTVGFGGHSEGLLERYPNLQIVGIDRDLEALEFSRQRLARFGERVRLLHGRASQLLPTLKKEPIVGVLADIGVSSYQLDREERGFNFQSGVLDMRMDQTQPLSAYEVVNSYSREELGEVLKKYGEIKKPQPIVEKIVRSRPINSNRELVQVLTQLGRKTPKSWAPIFQAIRIEVNRELEELEQLLDAIEEVSRPEMVVGIITFHSLEDRIVKNRFREWAKSCICPPDLFKCECGGDNSLGKILTKKPITPTPAEVARNPRARSAKLRGFLFERGADFRKRVGTNPKGSS